ncbi:helix-turn-helix domain-containing protein [Phormidesmis priestleyi]
MEVEKGIEITQGSNNVFKDLGFDAEEASNLKIRADLILDLRKHILAQGWNHEQAAAFFGETQPCISHLLNGEIHRFSVDQLINLLTRAGMEVSVQVSPKAV